MTEQENSTPKIDAEKMMREAIERHPITFDYETVSMVQGMISEITYLSEQAGKLLIKCVEAGGTSREAMNRSAELAFLARKLVEQSGWISENTNSLLRDPKGYQETDAHAWMLPPVALRDVTHALDEGYE